MRLLTALIAILVSACTSNMGEFGERPVRQADASTASIVTGIGNLGRAALVTHEGETYGVTCAHVLDPVPLALASPNRGGLYGVDVVARDDVTFWSVAGFSLGTPPRDLAVFEAQGNRGVELADPEPGEPVFVWTMGGGVGGTITTTTNTDPQWLLADLDVWPGLSGSGVYNAEGAVVGVVNGISSRGTLITPAAHIRDMINKSLK